MKTGLESLDTGASKITYSGNEGPKAPMQMAMADPLLIEEYQKYVFEMEEQGLQPMSFEEFEAQARAGMNKGGIADITFSRVQPSKDGSRPGYFTRAQEEARTQGKAMSPGTSAGGGGRDGPPGRSTVASPLTPSPKTGGTPPGGDDLEDDAGTKIDPTIIPKDKDGNFLKTYLDERSKDLYNIFKFTQGEHTYNKRRNFIASLSDPEKRALGYNFNKDYEDLTDEEKERLMSYDVYKDLNEVGYQDFLKKDYEEKFGLPGGGGDAPGRQDLPQNLETGIPTPTLPVLPPAQIANPFLPGTGLPFSNYYVGANPNAAQLAYGKQMGVDPRMYGLTTYAADGGRIGYAGGGIADLRQGYFLGKLVKKIGKGIKKVVKSPLGKAALLAGAMYFGPSLFSGLKMGITGAQGPLQASKFMNLARFGRRAGEFARNVGPMKGILAASTLPLIFGESQEEEEGTKYADLPNIFDKYSPDELRKRALAGELPQDEFPFQQYYGADGGRVGLMNGGDLRVAALNQLYGINDEEDKKFSQGGSAGLPPITAGIEGQASQSFSDDETPAPTQPHQMPKPMPNPMMMAGRMNPMMMAGRINPMMSRGMMPRMMANEGGRMMALGEGFKSEELNRMAINMFGKELRLLNRDELEQLRDEYEIKKGRVEAQEGGLMDLGGMEKDYRNEGGFVPIGGQERADDVPARLSKNEFVFTADAVRAAGGGDIDKGAEVMENMMENLEKGGKVSEESQGLKGARDMFATAQRLEGVL